MMLTGVSTRSTQLALQRSLIVLQRELAVKQIEVQTGSFADVGLSLGEKSETLISVTRDVARFDSILETNKLATIRLETTQTALEAIRGASDSVLSSLVSGDHSAPGRQISAVSARSSLGSIVSALNTNVSGQYIFGGLNSDTAPINPGNGIPAGDEADAAFLSYFGFAKTDPSASAITVAAFNAFVTSEIEPLYYGSGWEISVSNASDDSIHSRITLQEVAETSVSANEQSIRKIMFGMSLAANFLDSALNAEVARSIVGSSTNSAMSGLAEAGQLQSKTGLVQERLSKSDSRLASQRDILIGLGENLSSVDPYESSVKLNSLITQIEISYALTQKIQNLSILRFLG